MEENPGKRAALDDPRKNGGRNGSRCQRGDLQKKGGGCLVAGETRFFKKGTG